MSDGRVWTVREALDWTVGHFQRKEVPSPRRSAEWLLSAATGLTRVEIYAFGGRALSEEERATLRDSVERRASGEPLQYVTGEVPFRHLVLKVRSGVFIPRPETEVLVDEALAALPPAGSPASPVAVDLCTGSGAVALSIAHERPDVRVFATEIEEDVAEVARENAARCGLTDRVAILRGDLFEALPPDLAGRVDVVAANPPYIPTADMESLPHEVAGFEPHSALDGGQDGLDVVRRIGKDATAWLRPGGTLVIETDTSAAKAAANVLAAWYEGIKVVPDLTGRDRIVTGRTKEADER